LTSGLNRRWSGNSGVRAFTVCSSPDSAMVFAELLLASMQNQVTDKSFFCQGLVE
jgi:hypothetical protein